MKKQKKARFFLPCYLFFLSIFGFINLGNFFDISQDPIISDVIVSLGGDNGNRIKKTLSLYKNGVSKSKKLILTGVDGFDPSMKIHELDWRANYLIKKGVSVDHIIFNGKATNTLEEVFFIKDYMKKNKLHSVLFITDAPHSRRIGFFVSQVAHYADVNITFMVVATENEWWHRDKFYTNPDAVIFVINEAIKLTYYYIKNVLGMLHENK